MAAKATKKSSLPLDKVPYKSPPKMTSKAKSGGAKKGK